MKNFSSSDLNPGIINQLDKKGITEPTEIQSKSIPTLLEHEGDFVARSATGTGKTIAFGASLLSRIITFNLSVQAVVLVPTRELCEQVGQNLSYLAEGIENLKVEAVYAAIAEEFHDFEPVTPYPSWIVDQLVVFSSDKLAEWCILDRLQS